MNYIDYLKDILFPLGVYDLDEGAGAAELESLGDSLDRADEETIYTDKESNIITSTSYGLEKYEDILPYAPVSSDVEARRNAIKALLQIDDMSFTVLALNSTLSGCGINAKVSETDEKYVVSVRFPDNNGIPENIEEIKKRISEIIPCHLDIIYIYTYPTWREILLLGTWNDIESRLMTWNDVERFKPA